MPLHCSYSSYIPERGKPPLKEFIRAASRQRVYIIHVHIKASLYLQPLMQLRWVHPTLMVAFFSTLKTQITRSSINDFMQLYKDDENGEISRTEYERIYDKLISILRPGTDVMEKKKLMAEDWKRDCKGQETMTKEMLYDCLFEMVDVWCPNIDPNDYKAFFDQIKFRIRYEGQNDSRAYDILG